jgi:hypothetical protein
LYEAHVVAARQSRADTQVALERLAAQRELARQHAEEALELERERHRRERLEKAYAQLLIWCSTLESVIDDLWCACCDGETTEVIHAHKVACDWPFTILKEPPEAAGYRHYWSAAVHDRMAAFGRASAQFAPAVSMILGAELKAEAIDAADKRRLKLDLWQSRTHMLQMLTQVRVIARNEVLTEPAS